MEELDIKDIIKLFWRKKISIAVIIAIFTIVGIIYTIKFVTPKYESHTTLVLAKDNQYVVKIGEDRFYYTK